MGNKQVKDRKPSSGEKSADTASGNSNSESVDPATASTQTQREGSIPSVKPPAKEVKSVESRRPSNTDEKDIGHKEHLPKEQATSIDGGDKPEKQIPKWKCPHLQLRPLMRVMDTLAGSSLENQVYFHGFVPREEVTPLLKKKGDFLVRKAKRSGVTQIIVTTLWDDQIRHFAIQEKNGMFYFEEHRFSTVPMLILYYWRSCQPITVDAGCILATPIGRERWEFAHEDIILDAKLGEGNFGSVYRAHLVDPITSEKIEVAVKTCREQLPVEERRQFLVEAQIMRRYIHPNVVRMIGVCAQKDPVMIVMELITGGSLLDHLVNNKGKLTMRTKSKFCIDTASGMEYLEAQKCIHRDLAARNCLLTKENVAKIADFGMSKIGMQYRIRGPSKLPARWTAPEAFDKGVFTSKSDVWSFGVLMWEIYTDGEMPYDGIRAKDVRQKIKAGYRLELPRTIHPDIEAIMTQCFQYKSEDRPGFSEIQKALSYIHMVLPHDLA